MINVENMRLWIAALRSRKYKQQKGSLYGDQNKSCALGVAGRELLGATEYNFYGPSRIAEKLGINDAVFHNIVRLNDSQGLKFYQIARWLERKYKNELGGKG